MPRGGANQGSQQVLPEPARGANVGSGTQIGTRDSGAAVISGYDAASAGAARLTEAGLVSPAADARLLLCHATGLELRELLLADALSPAEQERYEAALARRIAGEPVQHITGVAYFRYEEIAVGPGVFIPRPETELLVELALAELANRPKGQRRVVELCAGSGAISRSLAREFGGLELYAVEISDQAWPWLQRNLADTDVKLVLADMASALPELAGTVDLVVVNPPYIPESMRAELPTDVVGLDPDLALFSGADGLDALRVVHQVAARLLKPGGWVFAEHDQSHAEQVIALFNSPEFTQVRDHQDLAGRPRHLAARRSLASLATQSGSPHGRIDDVNQAPTTVFNLDTQAAEGITAAAQAITAGQCIVLPTDTVYGIGADAFSSAAVQKLLDAKQRGADMPPPVLVAEPSMLRALASDIPADAMALAKKHWPGALTLILKSQRTLKLEIGETDGTVAVRVPAHEGTRELLRRTGPLAVSSANISGSPAATSCQQAEQALGEAVSVYLDGGPSGDQGASTIIDFTQNESGQVLRQGVLSFDELRLTATKLAPLAAQTQPEASLSAEATEVSPQPTAGEVSQDPAVTDTQVLGYPAPPTEAAAASAEEQQAEALGTVQPQVLGYPAPPANPDLADAATSAPQSQQAPQALEAAQPATNPAVPAAGKPNE